MVHNIFQHVVDNFESWYEGFKHGEPHRQKHGVRINGVYRGHDDPNHVTIHSEADSHESYDNMMSDPEFQEAMKNSGVQGRPNMHKMTRVD
jgi:quinol monooxygenase YgiN